MKFNFDWRSSCLYIPAFPLRISLVSIFILYIFFHGFGVWTGLYDPGGNHICYILLLTTWRLLLVYNKEKQKLRLDCVLPVYSFAPNGDRHALRCCGFSQRETVPRSAGLVASGVVLMVDGTEAAEVLAVLLVLGGRLRAEALSFCFWSIK